MPHYIRAFVQGKYQSLLNAASLMSDAASTSSLANSELMDFHDALHIAATIISSALDLYKASSLPDDTHNLEETIFSLARIQYRRLEDLEGMMMRYNPNDHEGLARLVTKRRFLKKVCTDMQFDARTLRDPASRSKDAL